MRPIQALGLCPDGVHRWLYARSRDGNLSMNPEMFAREYGTTYRRFAETCKVLIHDGDLQYSQSNHTLLKSFWVTEPTHYDSNDDRLGQLAHQRRWILDYSAYDPTEPGVRELTTEEMSEAIDLYDCVTDELLEAFDELDLETST